MNRLHMLLGVMVAIIVALALAVAYLIGRQSSGPATPMNSATNAPALQGAVATNQTAAPSRPAQIDPTSDAELSRWIVGSWSSAESNCETDVIEGYAAGGTFYGYEAEGRWRIRGGQLSVTITRAQQDPNLGLAEGELTPVRRPRPELSTVSREGPNRMTLTRGNHRQRMVRCPGASDAG